jgi:putative transposase
MVASKPVPAPITSRIQEEDWRRHMDYLHYNPVKHGLVSRVSLWPWSSFQRAVAAGRYTPDWGSAVPENLEGVELE